MQISTSTLLASLGAKNLQDVHEKGLDTLAKKEPSVPVVVEVKSKSIGELMDSLFKEVASNVKTKEAVSQILKSPEITKNIQSPTSELQSLAKELASEPLLQKYTSKIEKFLVDIKNIDATLLKEQVQNSGSFMEAKFNTLEKIPNEVPQKLQTLLKELANILQSIKATPTPISTIQAESNTFFETLANTKDIHKGLVADMKKLFETFAQDMKIDKKILQELVKFENIFSQTQKPKLQMMLFQLKNTLVEHTNNSISNDKISSLSNSLMALKEAVQPFNREFVLNLQSSLGKIKSLPILDTPLLKNLAKVEVLLGEVKLIESKINNASPLDKKELQNMHNEIKNILLDLKVQVAEPKGVLNQLPQKSTDTITKLIDTLLFQNSIFNAKSAQTFDTSSTLTKLSQMIKSELGALDVKQPAGIETLKSIFNLEGTLKKEIELFVKNPPSRVDNLTLLKQELSLDIKSTLLQLREELNTRFSFKTKENISLHVDKTLGMLEYYQLSSHVNNASSSYLPFLWKDLEKGEVTFKRLKENRFFCEINLSLKEYGKIDLMVMLYDDIHINLSVFAQKKEFIEKFQEHLAKYKVGLNDLGLILANVQFFDALKEEKLKKQTYDFVSNEQLDMGINIKV